MRIELYTLEEGISPIKLVESADSIGITDELTCLEPIEVDITVARTGEQFHLKGRATVLVEMECSRCLTRFKEWLHADFEVLVSLTPWGLRDRVPRWNEEFVFLPPEAQEVDISRLVREIILLSVPMKPLCREDCKGLCPECGQDLNRGECGCSRRSVDPRWAMLRELLDNP